MKEGYIGEVVYDGGGNFLILFKDIDTFRDITYEFTRTVMEKVGTLQVLGSAVEIDGFEDYKGDQKRLRLVHSKNESAESSISPWVTLPISMIDRRTGMPITKKYDGVECSKETYAKLSKYKTIKDKDSVDIFDKMVEEKGIDSNLAVVYIDGNSMGAKVENVLGDKKDYASCAKALREFSDEIQRIYVDEGVKSVEKVLDDKKIRVVVAAGDEINFVVKASEALKCTKSYLEDLSEHKGASACAGIAVFNSHAPYSDAYRIAEECCESGKKIMKKKNIKNACFIDFQLIQNGIGISLKEIRKHEMTLDCSRPWLITATDFMDESIVGFDKVEKIVETFNKLGRSNVKELSSAAKNDLVSLKLELNRIKAHYSNNDKNVEKQVKNELKELILHLDHEPEKIRALIYDIVISYDLWFKRGETNEI
ncbi:MAG: hypothetical protein J6O73_05430 [Lachnospiraceae bacterium]|nr:hypothetical protein [Lachnospiraceae bacterium]